MGLTKLFALAAAAAAIPSTGMAAEMRRGEGSPEVVVPETTAGPLQAPPVPVGERANGSVFIGYRGSDGETTGALVTVSPVRRTFVRVGAEITPRSPDGRARFLWGLGFEDPRDRTPFLHVHDWGPVRPDQDVTLRTAEASFGYKLPRLRGGPFLLAASPFVSLPFEGGPYVGARTTVVVRRAWFASTSFGWTLPGVLPGVADPRAWRLSFALGRWDGRPGGLFVTYRDDLSARQYDDWSRVDRHGRGILALGVNWAH